jgi:hypothetical protein
VHIKKWHYVHAKAEFIWIKGSGSGSCLSPSSLIPHPRDQGTTQKYLLFNPATPPTFLSWPRHGVMAVTVLTVEAGCCYCPFRKHCMISLHFLRNYSAGRLLLLSILKTSVYFRYFSQKRSFVNNVGWDQEFSMTDAGKRHFEERCIR